MNSTIDSYFATVRQIAAERGATYSHGTTWAAVDSTRDGERVVVEVTFHEGDDTPYWAADVYEYYDAGECSNVSGDMGAYSNQLYRFLGRWV